MNRYTQKEKDTPQIKENTSIPSHLFVAIMQVDIRITPGAHISEVAVNKQLNDKERVAAALENANLLDIVNKCISDS
jgi:hypothetical protein